MNDRGCILITNDDPIERESLFSNHFLPQTGRPCSGFGGYHFSATRYATGKPSLFTDKSFLILIFASNR